MNYLKYKLSIVLFLTALSGFGQSNAPTGLLCNLLPHPELSEITDKTPDFGWIVNAGVKEDYQTAYQVEVATSASLLKQDQPDLWNTEKKISSESINIRYAGKSLEPHHRYYWRVCSWGRTGMRSPWSNIQIF